MTWVYVQWQSVARARMLSKRRHIRYAAPISGQYRLASASPFDRFYMRVNNFHTLFRAGTWSQPKGPPEQRFVCLGKEVNKEKYQFMFKSSRSTSRPKMCRSYKRRPQNREGWQIEVIFFGVGKRDKLQTLLDQIRWRFVIDHCMLHFTYPEACHV